MKQAIDILTREGTVLAVPFFARFIFDFFDCFRFLKTCFPLWGEWILRAMRVKDERGLVLQEHCEYHTLFALMTSIGLTSISFRQPTFPKGESKNG